MQYVSCFFCGLQHQQQHLVSCDSPVYQQNSDTIKMVNKKICKSCNSIIVGIQNYVKQSEVQFGNHKFKSHVFEYYPFLQITSAKKSMQLIYATSMQQVQLSRRSSEIKNVNLVKRMSLPEKLIQQTKEESIHPYIVRLIQQVINKNYLTMQHLSKTLQYFIHLTSFNLDKKNNKVSINPEERHQKIKNIILFLSQKINISIEQLPDVLFLVNFLLCFMDSSKVINIVIQLSNIMIFYPHLLSWKSLLTDQERPNTQSPLSPATFDMKTSLILIDRLWIKIEYIIDISRRGQSILREGLIRMSKFEQNSDAKQLKKRLNQASKLLLGRKQQLQLFNEQQMQLLYILKQQRNSFSLIMKEVIEQEQNMKIQMNKIQHKFRLEKDQFIQKIIRLNQRIQELQGQLKKSGEINTQNKTESFINEIQVIKSQVQIVDVHEEQETDENANQSQKKIINIINQLNLAIFNHKHHISDKQIDSYKDVQSYLIDQVGKMQQFIIKLSGKTKVVEDQKTRLIDIISRKQQRYLGVIMEKDTIIQKYQQALWTLQNGIFEIDGPLSHRIQYIMQLFAKKTVLKASSQAQQVLPQFQIQNQKQPVEKQQKNCQIY